MPGDRGGNGVTAGTVPAAGTGKDPGLLGKLTAIAGAPGRVPGRRPGLTPGAGQSRDSLHTKIYFQQTKMFHDLRRSVRVAAVTWRKRGAGIDGCPGWGRNPGQAPGTAARYGRPGTE